jgi:hypothetical protein
VARNSHRVLADFHVHAKRFHAVSVLWQSAAAQISRNSLVPSANAASTRTGAKWICPRRQNAARQTLPAARLFFHAKILARPAGQPRNALQLTVAVPLLSFFFTSLLHYFFFILPVPP